MRKRILFMWMVMLLMAASAAAQAPDLTSDTNLARESGTSATASVNSNDASKAIDGTSGINDSDHQWESHALMTETEDVWWQLDLGESKSFTLIRVIWEGAMSYDYNISFSNDGSTWSDVIAVRDQTDSKLDIITKTGPKNYRYIRITNVKARSSGWGIKIQEVEVYNHTYYLASAGLTISPSKIDKNKASTITVVAKDNDGDDYYDFTLAGAATGTVIQKVDGTQNQYNITLSSGFTGSSETITATDNNDNSKTATATVNVEEAALDNLQITAGNKGFLESGQTTTITCYDQFGAVRTSVSSSDISVSQGTISGSGGVFVYTPASVSDDATITVNYDGVEKQLTLYSAENVEAPSIFHDIYKPIFTVYDNETGPQVFSYPSSPATFGNYYTAANGFLYKHIKQANSFVIGRNDTSIYPSSNGNGILEWDPSSNNGKLLKAQVFVPTAGEQARFNLESNAGTQDWQTLNAGWNVISYEVPTSATIHAIRIETKQREDNSYPDILVANVYFTKNSTDNTAPAWTTDYPTITPDKTSIKFALKATDNETSAEDLHFFITSSQGGINKYVKGSEVTGDDMEYTLSGLAAGTNYGTITITAYDEMGNASTAFTSNDDIVTQQLDIESFTITPSVISIPKNGNSQDTPLTFKVIAEDGSDITASTTITYAEYIDNVNFTDVVSYDATGHYFTANSGVTDGHGDYRFTATYGTSTATKDVEIFVYETDLKIKYKLNATDNWSEEETGEFGKLQKLIDDNVPSGKDHKDVYALKVIGNINDADIKTLRHMAGGADNATADASLGNLHVLDLKAVKFAATPSYAENLPEGSNQEEIEDRQTARIANCFVQAVDTTYTTNLIPDGTQPEAQPFFITTGGYSAWDSQTQTTYHDVAAPNEWVEVNEVNPKNEGLRGFEILPSHIFDHCVNLTDVTLPDGIKQFGTRCFNECNNLTTIRNYGDVIDFGSYAFAGCESLTSFDLTQAKQKNTENVEEPYLRIIGTGTFMYCENLTTVTMPDDIRYIGGNAFAFCPKFTLGIAGTLPSSLERIGQYAFFTLNDKALTNVVLGSNLKSIDGYAFDAKDGSTNTVDVDFTAANNLKFIGYRAFADNHAMTFTLTNNQLPNSIQEIDTYGFANTAITNVKLPVNVYYKTVKESSFGYNQVLESVEIPANVTHIMNSAFVDGPLARFTLNNKSSLVYIGASAFQACKAVEDDFDGVTAVAEIGAQGFESCEKLTDASAEDLMKNLTVINEQTFANCTSLTALHLTSNTEKTLTRIDKEAFAGDRNVGLVKVYSTSAPTCYMNYYETVPVSGATNGETENRYVDRNPFRGLVPNKVVLDFNDNYNASYRARQDNDEKNANELGDAKGNGFLYLLTKYMRETGNENKVSNLTIDGANVTYSEVASTEDQYVINPDREEGDPAIYGSRKYNVVDQEHADVILERTVGVNWNTIMLPFTMTAAQLAQTFDGYNPVVAKYGWGDVYIHQEYGRDAVLQFETVSQLNANTPYLFLLVNQAGGSTQTINTSTWNVSDVDIHNAPTTAVGAGYTFTGSYDDQENIVSDDHGILYVNANSGFSYKNAGATTKTRMKGFRAYFTFGSSVPGSAKTITVANFDDYAVTGISTLDNWTGSQSDNLTNSQYDDTIYDLQGRKVANGKLENGQIQLPKGIYVVNGKKIAVK